MAGSDVYNTVNGAQTVDAMREQLFNAGWDGSGTIQSAYARTTGGAVTPGASGSNPSNISITPGAPKPVDQGANLNAAQILLSSAKDAAYQAYLNARLNLDTDAQAFTQAQQAFTNHVTEAGLTGMYNGQPTLAAQAQQQSTANDYLKLIAGLRGPQDYGQYLKVLASTPGGLKDLVASASGRYVPGGGTTGVSAVPVSLGGVIGQATAGAGAAGGVSQDVANLLAQNPSLANPAYQQELMKTRGYVFTQDGNDQAFQQAAARGWNPTSLTYDPSQVGVTAQGGSPQQSQYADYMAAAQGLPAPNQISPAAWNAYTTTQKQLLAGMYEAQGYNVQDVTDLYKQSLPQYRAPTTGMVKIA